MQRLTVAVMNEIDDCSISLSPGGVEASARLTDPGAR
jgi:hypothetical protein